MKVFRLTQVNPRGPRPISSRPSNKPSTFLVTILSLLYSGSSQSIGYVPHNGVVDSYTLRLELGWRWPPGNPRSYLGWGVSTGSISHSLLNSRLGRPQLKVRTTEVFHPRSSFSRTGAYFLLRRPTFSTISSDHSQTLVPKDWLGSEDCELDVF